MSDNKDAFDLWWEWAEKPRESMLMIDGDIHYPVMELSPEDRRNREKSTKLCAGIESATKLPNQNFFRTSFEIFCF
jgi:hypothetical protein